VPETGAGSSLQRKPSPKPLALAFRLARSSAQLKFFLQTSWSSVAGGFLKRWELGAAGSWRG
jgi:hypothetical protein